MGRRSKSKKRTAKRAPALPRGCRGNRRRRDTTTAAAAVARRAMPMHDLNVHLPQASRKAADGGRRAASDSRLALVDRLRSTGFGVVAFSHTVYGRPDLDGDRAGVVLPDSAIAAALGQRGTGRRKKRRRDDDEEDRPSSTTGDIEGVDAGDGGKDVAILRRLNVVVEELSDLANYTETSTTSTSENPSQSTAAQLLDAYDVIALSPRSDATFSSACATARLSDVIMLDYTAGRGAVQLPFRLRPSDVRAAARRGAALELCYGPAVLDPAKRKALVRTAVDLRNACLGVRDPSPRIVLSSGSRVVSGNDYGPMALRAPGDLVNVLRTVLGFGDGVAADALGRAAADTVARGRDRRVGRCSGSGRSNGGMGGASVSVYVDDSLSGVRPVDDSVRTAPVLGGMEGSLLEGSVGGTKRQKKMVERETTLKEEVKLEGRNTGKEKKGEKLAGVGQIDREEDNSDEDGFINLS